MHKHVDLGRMSTWRLVCHSFSSTNNISHCFHFKIEPVYNFIHSFYFALVSR